jgi:threonyl-tRNA synthetase
MPKQQKDQAKELRAMRHSCEHVLHQAVYRLYGQEKIRAAMGPATEDGFYFDLDSGDLKLSEADFPKIEAEMAKIICDQAEKVGKRRLESRLF